MLVNLLLIERESGLIVPLGDNSAKETGVDSAPICVHSYS
ncbi:hypothetical protein BMS3Bbin04_01342 [bacterium BMS3Bbin04]|nr:hypothetical protein BMS3Bbin04_01342 [bacterium BMS3Bbin04]